MAEVILRAAVAAVFLLAATLLPLMFALTGDPELAATLTAVLVPVAALLIAGTVTEHHRWRTERREVRRWARALHPAGKTPARKAAPCPPNPSRYTSPNASPANPSRTALRSVPAPSPPSSPPSTTPPPPRKVAA